MKKFGNYIISDETPKEGDRVICIQKRNFNFGKIEVVTKIQADLGVVDSKNWKLITNSENEITVEGLNEFKNKQEVVYASRFGQGVNKKIVLTLSGGFKVYNNNEVILENLNVTEAVKTYNLL